MKILKQNIKKIVVIASLLLLFTNCSNADLGFQQKSAADVVEGVLPSVVNISALTIVKEYSYYGSDVDDFFRFFGMPVPKRRPQPSMGSGFIISKDGEVLTNNHVVERADEVHIILADGSKHKAKIVGRDSKLDIALLKIETKKKFSPLKIGDADKVRIAEDVYAIGNPFGLSHSVSKGIISAKHRSLGAGPFDDFLQTDASINFGNSGGPLINNKGEVIGINTAVKAHSQGIGFAIPINMVAPTLDQIRKHGKVLRSWLGIAGRDVPPRFAKKVTKGVVIERLINNGPAHRDGLRQGDVIVDVNGKKVESADELQRILSPLKDKERIAVRVYREGEYLIRPVKLGQYPSEESLPRGYEIM
ncbi:trypsin-like peptidase domain-containing protein [Bdellovibrionota bacterium]